jgi:aldose 1-epimerase
VQASITPSAFGHLPDGRGATLYTLRNPNGMLVKISDFGGIITEIHVPDRHGAMADVTLGFDHLAPYVTAGPYFGALIGRYCNRLRDGRFPLDGRLVQLPCNDGAHHLHGGALGFHRVLWRAIPFQEGDSVGLTLVYRSPNGEQGYPGTLDVTVVYELTAANELVLAFDAVTDKATPVNLTQHAYFNLAGGGDILGHHLRIDADRYAPVDSTLIPTGELAPVAGSAFDFRSAHAIGARIGDDNEQLRHGSGYDHHFVLTKPAHKALALALAARVHEPVSGRVLELFTEEPGLQFYSGNFLDGKLTGKGWNYGYRSGFCLEPQHVPDSPNQCAFPNTILRPGEEYATVSKYKFSVEK